MQSQLSIRILVVARSPSLAAACRGGKGAVCDTMSSSEHVGAIMRRIFTSDAEFATPIMSKARCPLTFCTNAEAPASIKAQQTSLWPRATAKCIGVLHWCAVAYVGARMNQPCILEYSHTRCLSSSPSPLLQRWISWARKYQGILSQDFVTLSLTTSCVNETKPTLKCSLDPSTGIDAIIHHGSPGIRTDFSERAMVMVWNPSQVAYNGSITGEGSLYHGV